MKTNWDITNQHHLAAALTYIRELLERQVQTGEHTKEISASPEYPAWEEHEPEEDGSAEPPAIELVCTLFGLSPFERDLLLLCAGVELDSRIATLCATLQGSHAHPTFGLALAAFPRAHWSALLPNAPLRYWRMLTLSTEQGLTASPLQIDERLLHYLAGIDYPDEKLEHLIKQPGSTGVLFPSHQELAARIAGQWEQTPFPVIQLYGAFDKSAIAVEICRLLDLRLGRLSLFSLQPTELANFVRLWERETRLNACVLLIEGDELEAGDQVRQNMLIRLLETLRGAIILCRREPQPSGQRSMFTFEVQKPASAEQRQLWQNTIDLSSLNGTLDTLLGQFHLSATHLLAVTQEVQSYQITHPQASQDELARFAWNTCRFQTRSRLEELAQRIEVSATWEDLVLPESQRHTLRDITIHVKHRALVYENWGFSSKGARGLGISALFTGASGTGKTMAAEALASELRLDLFRIDLSQTVSKYIGETEKNLRKLFDAAEEGGAILLFDEADALFGKRSEVKDSHDRYANIEVSYLLQRMESYHGLTILTTNLKSALDNAFLRRIRFIVPFPFPDQMQREEIWRRIFPANTPRKELDEKKLAKLNVTGGNIRNIALNGAFLAAEDAEPVGMKHLLRAARNEYTKLEKSLTDAEIGGWL